MKFTTLEEEFFYIQSKNKARVLDPQECVAYALSHENSLIRQHFPNQKEAAYAHYLNIVRGLIRVHYKVEPTHSSEPIRVWVAPYREGAQPRNYVPTMRVLDDEDQRAELVRAEIERLWSVWKSYRLPELQAVADVLEKLRARYSPSLAEAAE